MAAKFKVGDTVRRVGASCIDVRQGMTYIVAKYIHKSIRVVGSTHYYDAAAFELVEEGDKQMSTKFNRWDKVIRVCGNHGNTYEGGTYIVDAVSGKNLMLQGDDDYTYDVDSFKLVSAAHPVLTQEGAAIALLKGKPIQYWHCGEWLDFTNLELPWTEVRTLINSAKLRLKPTPKVLLNGVEVVAPIQDADVYRKTHSNDEKVYRFDTDLTEVVAIQVRCMHVRGTYWETSQDAARALKEIRKALTMIIPE